MADPTFKSSLCFSSVFPLNKESSSSQVGLIGSSPSNESSLNNIKISDGIESTKLEELLKQAHTSLGNENQFGKFSHNNVDRIQALGGGESKVVGGGISLLRLKVDKLYEETNLSITGNGSVANSSISTTSGSSLASLSSGFEEPAFFETLGTVNMVTPPPSRLPPQIQSQLEPQHHIEQRSIKMSRPIRLNAPANKIYQAARYKTELCLHFREHNTCPHGDMCLFAHGLSELRPYRGRHPKHKTQPCRSFHQTGFCDYGYRCSYIHLESPETITYLRGLNVKALEKNKLQRPKVDVRFTSHDRLQFKHKVSHLHAPASNNAF